jgi:hypothetical protein
MPEALALLDQFWFILRGPHRLCCAFPPGRHGPARRVVRSARMPVLPATDSVDRGSPLLVIALVFAVSCLVRPFACSESARASCLPGRGRSSL